MSDLEPLILTSMAKNSLFWGKASGKLGEMVLYRAGGEQRARTYIKNVKNPKSLAQMEQRIKLASLNGFFKALKPILRFSFPQRPVNQSGFNAFMAASLPGATTALAAEFANEGLSVPLNYAISRGDILLPAGAFAPVVYADGATDSLVGGLQLFPTGTGIQNEVSAITPGSKSAFVSAMQATLERYPELSNQLPLKFNFVVVSSTYKDEGFETEYLVYKFDRTGGTLDVEMPSQIAFRSGVMPIWLGTTGIGTAIIVGGIQEAEDNGASFAGAFFSYTGDDGKLHVSNGTMKVAHDGDDYVKQFQKGGVSYDSYLDGLGYTAGDILSTR